MPQSWPDPPCAGFVKRAQAAIQPGSFFGKAPIRRAVGFGFRQHQQVIHRGLGEIIGPALPPESAHDLLQREGVPQPLLLLRVQALLPRGSIEQHEAAAAPVALETKIAARGITAPDDEGDAGLAAQRQREMVVDRRDEVAQRLSQACGKSSAKNRSPSRLLTMSSHSPPRVGEQHEAVRKACSIILERQSRYAAPGLRTDRVARVVMASRLVSRRRT